MAKKPFPFSVCEKCCVSGGGTGDGGLTETEVVDIIKNNTQSGVDGDTTLPISVGGMIEYVDGAINNAIGVVLGGYGVFLL